MNAKGYVECLAEDESRVYRARSAQKKNELRKQVYEKTGYYAPRETSMKILKSILENK